MNINEYNKTEIKLILAGLSLLRQEVEMTWGKDQDWLEIVELLGEAKAKMMGNNKNVIIELTRYQSTIVLDGLWTLNNQPQYTGKEDARLLKALLHIFVLKVDGII